MKVAAVVTARGGSKSIVNKNIILVNGKPLISYPIDAALNSSCQDVYVDSDCDRIGQVGIDCGATFIKRPDHLGADDTHHGDVIRHTCLTLLSRHEYDAFLILLGNTVMIDSELIDTSISMLNNNKSASSICSVWKAADDHPYRSMYINEDGFLESFPDVCRPSLLSTDRASYKPAYFYDQGVWLFRSSNLSLPKQGPASWDWLGSHPLPLEREWITGRDINGPFDVPFHTYWNHLRNTPETFTYS